MGASLGGRRGKKGFREINVTPLVDVMLVLLVVFMVTAPLLTTGLRIELPNVQAANTPVKDSRLLVTVSKEEKVLFGEEDVTGRIREALLNNPRVQTEKELYIRADKDARYGIVAEVVAAARSSGVQSLNLLVQPELEEVEEEETPAPGTPVPGAPTPGTPAPPGAQPAGAGKQPGQ